MSSIGSISGNSISMYQAGGLRNMQRPDPSKMADNLFSKLDSAGQGYIQKVDLQSALDKVSTASSSSTNTTNTTSSGGSSVDDLFSQLDGNGDGKVTKDEFSSSLKSLLEKNRPEGMSGGGSGMMGGPGGMQGMPPGGGAGLTKDQLSGMAKDVSSPDSTASSDINNLVQNFDKADTNSDGKVSFQESMAYKQKTESDSSSSSTTNTSSSGSDITTTVMKQIMKLMQSYGANGANGSSSQAFAGLSVEA